MARGSIRAPPSTRIGRFRVRLIPLGFHPSLLLVSITEVGTGKVSGRFGAGLDAPWARVAANTAASQAFALDGPLTLLIEGMAGVGAWGMSLARGTFPPHRLDVGELTYTADAVMSDVFPTLAAQATGATSPWFRSGVGGRWCGVPRSRSDRRVGHGGCEVAAEGIDAAGYATRHVP